MTKRKVPGDAPRLIVGYCRVSTDEQAREGLSLGAQQDAIKAYATRERLQLDQVIVDAGQSGATLQRPGFARVEAMIKAGSVRMLIVTKLDRATRSVGDLANLIKLFAKHDVDFVSLGESIDTTTAMGRAFVYFTGVFAELEREMIKERTEGGRRRKASLGGWAGGRAPYGYTFSEPGEGRRDDRRKRGPLVVDLAEGPWVKEIFRRHLAGQSIRAIAQALQAEGAPPPRGSRASWTRHSLMAILKNPVYSGVVRRGPLSYEGKHEPLITAEEWEAAQARFVPGKRLRDRKNTALLPFGLLRCARCGGGCGVHATTVKGVKYTYYRCQNADRGEGCNALGVHVEDVDRAVLDRLADLMRDPQLLSERIRKAGAEAFTRRDEIDAERAKLERKLAKLQRDRDTLLSRLTDSTLATSAIEERLAAIEAEEAPLRDGLAELVRENAALESVVIDEEFIRAGLAQLENAVREGPSEEGALLVRAVIERVEVLKGEQPRIYLWGRGLLPSKSTSLGPYLRRRPPRNSLLHSLSALGAALTLGYFA